MTYVIASPCIDTKDRACVDESPVDCIYEGRRVLYIHPDECVYCGACEPVCAVEAIFYVDDVPVKSAEFARINAECFAHTAAVLRSPGDASNVGLTDQDHPDIAAMSAAPTPTA